MSDLDRKNFVKNLLQFWTLYMQIGLEVPLAFTSHLS